jgi:hypothetical protein
MHPPNHGKVKQNVDGAWPGLPARCMGKGENVAVILHC